MTNKATWVPAAQIAAGDVIRSAGREYDVTRREPKKVRGGTAQMIYVASADGEKLLYPNGSAASVLRVNKD